MFHVFFHTSWAALWHIISDVTRGHWGFRVFQHQAFSPSQSLSGSSLCPSSMGGPHASYSTAVLIPFLHHQWCSWWLSSFAVLWCQGAWRPCIETWWVLMASHPSGPPRGQSFPAGPLPLQFETTGPCLARVWSRRWCLENWAASLCQPSVLARTPLNDLGCCFGFFPSLTKTIAILIGCSCLPMTIHVQTTPAIAFST